MQCHDGQAVLDLHDNIEDSHFLKYTGCNTCHDPHGYPGGVATENSFLVNLSTIVTSVTSAKTSGNPSGQGHNITMTGDLTAPGRIPEGTCTLVCHAGNESHEGSPFN